ncbi:TIGR02587 family membrane protein [Alkalinema sp. FACHB-956]|uniref:TIGR02587 family membrane protein n=1 Tax=Alkalinema sp. FACHB-956 TaxID=2692768 RepID=UPI0016850ACD|nr:TIGR02587 family membrane protein [Alkalinema sp. FACHB-956]MBD2328014.1 TIGR02587 family membrane protein [Alkalinema sp. FACHB-956]
MAKVRSTQHPSHHQSALKRECQDLVRGACGGFLFGIPLLYTMEVWWIGSSVTPPIMLASLFITSIVVFGLNYTAGFRQSSSVHWGTLIMDTVEAQAIGIVCSFLLLLLLREVTLETQLHEIFGKVIFESVPFSIGVSLANQFLTNKDSDENESRSTSQSQGDRSSRAHVSTLWQETFNDILATMMGALIVAFSIAPTDEVKTLAANTSGPWLILTIMASLLISYGIVFEANFSDQQKRRKQRGLFQTPLSETVMSYLVSLGVACAMLWFFQLLQWGDPPTLWVSYTIVLGLPATIGGAAGRLAL